jgi:phospholipid/cholesterol/gamma-HCH transport system ATP-binding protein
MSDPVNNKEVHIEVRSLQKSFRGGRDAVLKGASLSFFRGELTYILGSSGAGKSVLLKHILGLLQPDSGEVWVAGQNLAHLDRDRLRDHRTNFGMLFQNSALFDDFTIFENVAFPLREHTSFSETEIQEKVTRALSHLGMKTGYDKFPNELSGGMRKRVGLARAIVREPQILLYDEPTTGLDPVTRTTVDDLIADLKSRLHLTSIVISHDIPSALYLADRIAFLHQGQFVFQGTAKEFVRSEHPAIRLFLDAELRAARTLQSHLIEEGHA